MWLDCNKKPEPSHGLRLRESPLPTRWRAKLYPGSYYFQGKLAPPFLTDFRFNARWGMIKLSCGNTPSTGRQI